MKERTIKVTDQSEIHPEWMMGGNPRAIEAQEKRGQKQAVESESLPTKGLPEVAAALGIQIVGPVPGDPLFSNVRLPGGWKKSATDHSMWNNVVDDRDVVRATFFYKAAFYDRDAFISMV